MNVGRQAATLPVAAQLRLLNAERTRLIAEVAASECEIFDRLSNRKGPISDAINTTAEQLRREPERRRQFASRLAAEVRDIIRQTYGGTKESFAQAFRADSEGSERIGAGIGRPEESLAEMFNRAFAAHRFYGPTLAEMFRREFDRRLAYGKSDQWKDQPRGQPDNAGQFAEKPVTKRQAGKLFKQIRTL